jgi:hypothetical protein
MRALRLATTVFALVGMAGCSGVDPTSLRTAQSSRSVSLSTPYTYEEHYRLAGTTMVHTLAGGKYTARFEDDGGTYFDGPEKCLVMSAKFDSPEVAARNKAYAPKSFRCGIFVPTRTGEMPKVYFYQADDAPITTTTVQPLDPAKPPSSQVMLGNAAGYGLVDAIIAAERKNLHFNRDQPKDDSLKRALSTP